MEDRTFILSSVLVLVVAIFLGGFLVYSFQSLPQNASQDFSVSGTGKAYAKPDIALVSFGVQTEALKSQDAVDQNNTKMNAVTKAIKDLGVEEKDIQTTAYNLSLVYDWTQNGGRRFKGYSLNQQITVKIRNFDKINDILDKATVAGANDVGSLQFTVDDTEKVKSQARQGAIVQAKTKAQEMAKQAGLSLGKLVNVSESYGGGYPAPMYAGAGSLTSLEKSVAPDVQAGQMEVNVTVNLTYKVK